MKYIKLFLALILMVVLCGCYGTFSNQKYEAEGISITLDNHTTSTYTVWGWLENVSDHTIRIKMNKLESDGKLRMVKWMTSFKPGEKRYILIDDNCSFEIITMEGNQTGYLLLQRRS